MFPTEILVDIHPLVNTSILSTITYQPPRFTCLHKDIVRDQQRPGHHSKHQVSPQAMCQQPILTLRQNQISNQSPSFLISFTHTSYLSVFLHAHILSPENFTLGKRVNLRQNCPATKQRKSLV